MNDSSTPDRAVPLSPLKRALLALDDMQETLETTRRAQREPIAIVGMSCRFPGHSRTIDAFWDLLRDGVDAVTEVPKDRWDVDAYYDGDLNAAGKSYGRWGAFLDDIDRFDPQFFGIAPREAAGIDPQQRLLLEVTWEALERATIAPDKLSGTKTGVFVGMNSGDYSTLQIQRNDLAQIDAYSLSGVAHSIAAGRLSYVLGLQGPSMAIDTACSSSLVAVHLACQSLRQKECCVAVAAGVHITLSPLNSVIFSKLRMLAADGRCKTFDAKGDGFVEGEGCAAVVLKRLSDALAHRDRIVAVIRGSAVNQDGASSGLTAPNGPSQESVIRAALQQGDVRPSEVDYVEAHGTGTSLGDPIEVRALAAVLGEKRAPDRPLILGSVKTNIGHTQAAAGIAGLVKLALALEREEIPPTLHFSEPNPFIPWPELLVKVATERMPWRRGAARRVGGVSSFGFSGTNVHVVVEEAPVPSAAASAVDRPSHIVTLSAKSDRALTMLAGEWKHALDAERDVSLADVAFTANTGRAHFAHRLAMPADSIGELCNQLTAVVEGREAPRSVRTKIATADPPKIAMLCTGQGAQWAGMGREMYETQPTFRRALDRCADLLKSEIDQPLLSVLYPAAGHASVIDQTRYAQPALFAIEYALAELWKSWDVTPSVVLGHSVGEYVAACLAGVFSLEDGIKLVAARGRLMQSLPSGGVMAAIFAPEDRVRRWIDARASQISIAAINGPESIVVSGEGAAVERLLGQLGREDVHFERLTVSHAFHSPLMEPILAEFEREAALIKMSPPRLTLISNLTAQPVRAELATPAYWRRHLREPVRFAGSIATLQDLGCQILLEIGPTPTLSSMARPSLRNGSVTLASLRKGVRDWRQMLESVASLYARGVEIDWARFDSDYSRCKLAMPTYPFDRARHWIPEARTDSQTAGRRRDRSDYAHPLLGVRVSSPLKEVQFESDVSTVDPSYLADHVKRGDPVFPATAYLEMGLAAARETLGPGTHVFEELVISDPLVLGSDAITTQTIVSPDCGGRASFQFLSRDPQAEGNGDRWRLHGAGTLSVQSDPSGRAEPLEAVRVRCADQLPIDRYYARLLADGHQYGPGFRGIVALWRGELEALARVELPDRLKSEAALYRIHPALLDAAMQVLAAGVPNYIDSTVKDETFLPVSLGRCHVLADGASVAWSHVRLHDMDADGFTADVRLYGDDGRVIAEVEDVYHRRTTASQGAAAATTASWLYEIEWRAKPREGVALDGGDRGTWLIVSDSDDTAVALIDRLRRHGVTPVVVAPGDHVEQALADDFHPVRGIVHLMESGRASISGSPFDRLRTRESDPTMEAIETSVRNGCGSLLRVVQAIAAGDRPSPPRLWVVTRGAAPITGSDVDVAQSPLWGLARTVAAEHPDLRCTSIDLDPDVRQDDLDAACLEMLAPDADDQIALRGGVRRVARLIRSAVAKSVTSKESAEEQPIALEIAERGVLDRLELRPASRRVPGPGEIEVRVAAAGLNFRDVLNALGMYAGEPGPVGGECVGIVTAVGDGVTDLAVGDEVLGMALGSFRTYVTAAAAGFVRKPANLTIEQAATVPIAFLTAEYALNRLATMRAGDRVLIHAAAGGVGLAAVRLAQRAGAIVFATAGSAEKHAFLRSLGVEHIMSSRSLDFADQIRTLTAGDGIDIVLNSLTGDFIEKSLSVLRTGGRFIEIGRAGIWSSEQMAAKRPDVAYHTILLRHDDLAIIRPMLAELTAAFGAGDLEPLPSRTFPLSEAVDAFRFMAQAKHIGKIVIAFQAPRASAPVKISGDATYLITGGLGAIGLQVARGLVDGGARHIVLVGRREPGDEARAAIRRLQAAGAEARVEQADIARQQDVARVLAGITDQMPPLKGVIHAAGVLDDGVLLQQTWERFERVLAPKMSGAWHLHALTRDLDFFVMFSSMGALFGAPGQGNYATANAFLDGLATYRRARGLAAMTVDWGPWSGAGMTAAVTERDRQRWRDQGFGFIPPDAGVGLLGRLLRATVPARLAVLPIDWPVVFRRFRAGEEPPLLSGLAVGQSASARLTRADRRHLVAEVEAVAPNMRRNVVLAFIRDETIKVLGVEPDAPLDPRQPLRELGLDSLMAVELRNAIASALERTLPATLLFKHPTIEALADFVVSQLGLDAASDAPASVPAIDREAAEIAPLSDEETRQQLAEELEALASSLLADEM